MRDETRPDHEVAVIGAGFSGIGAAIKLDEAGFGDYVVLEQGDGVGGAWHWNTYPGVAVDIPPFSIDPPLPASAAVTADDKRKPSPQSP